MLSTAADCKEDRDHLKTKGFLKRHSSVASATRQSSCNMAVRLGACAAARSAVRFITCPIAVSLPQFSTLRTSGSSAVIPVAQTTGRFLSTVKFMDEKRSGEETVYFKKEDDVLLQNLLANHPEYDPKYSWNQSELGALAKDVTLACQKHGMKDPSAAFMKDLISIFASHGYKKEGSAK